jgi:tetratricopeptide (TPR) repeat protein
MGYNLFVQSRFVRPLVLIAMVFLAVAATLIYHLTQQSEIDYYRGNRFFEKARYSEAIKYFERSLELAPRKIEALGKLAQACQWSGQHRRAAQLFERLLKMEPANASVKLALAETLSWQKDYGRAIGLFREVIRQTGSFEAGQKLAEVYLWSGDLTAAAGLIDRLISNRPDDFKNKLLQAQLWYYSGDFGLAREAYAGLLRSPGLPQEQKLQLKLALAEIFLALNDRKAAEKIDREILAEAPGYLPPRLMLADILSWSRDYPGSIRFYEEVLKIQAENSRALAGLARVYSLQGRYQISEGTYVQALALEPLNLEWQNQLAEVLIWQKKYQPAVTVLLQALRVKDNLRSRFLIGQALLYSGQPEKARLWLDSALRREPGDLETRATLADSYSYSRDYGQAIKIYEDILSMEKK